ncbi:MAG: 3-hydroxyacyl-CoA dehydrogenase family protein, partial [Gammaproteobacteria bacterium]|nr:3-hydroxyacyl-CoA dehydrogenase family protein [Gammaproteobacteria bacterium]
MSTKAKISVIGAGLMGHGIAQVFAVTGHDVKITDAYPQTLGTVHERICRNLQEMSI